MSKKELHFIFVSKIIYIYNIFWFTTLQASKMDLKRIIVNLMPYHGYIIGYTNDDMFRAKKKYEIK